MYIECILYSSPGRSKKGVSSTIPIITHIVNIVKG